MKTIENIRNQLATLILNISNDKKHIKSDIESNSVNVAKAQRTADESKEIGRANELSIISAEQSITDLDLQNIVTEQRITDIDLRLIASEV